MSKFNLNRITPKENIKLIEAINRAASKKEIVCEVDCGGGNCGRWSAGAKTALYDLGFFPAITMGAGTSVGALNILMSTVYHNDWDIAVDTWCNITKNSDIYSKGMLQCNNLFDAMGMGSQILKDNKGQYVLYPDGLYKIFEQHFGKYKMGDLPLKTITTTTNLQTLDMIEYVSTIDTDIYCVDAAKRSSAMNGIFPMQEDDKGQYVDGGWGNNTPVTSAIKNGATKILLIGTTPDKVEKKRIKNNIIEIAGRSVEGAMHIFEEKMWDEYNQYELRCNDNSNLNRIEKLAIYPINDACSSTDFTNVKIMQDGYDYVINNISIDTLINFLDK